MSEQQTSPRKRHPAKANRIVAKRESAAEIRTSFQNATVVSGASLSSDATNPGNTTIVVSFVPAIPVSAAYPEHYHPDDIQTLLGALVVGSVTFKDDRQPSSDKISWAQHKNGLTPRSVTDDVMAVWGFLKSFAYPVHNPKKNPPAQRQIAYRQNMQDALAQHKPQKREDKLAVMLQAAMQAHRLQQNAAHIVFPDDTTRPCEESFSRNAFGLSLEGRHDSVAAHLAKVCCNGVVADKYVETRLLCGDNRKRDLQNLFDQTIAMMEIEIAAKNAAEVILNTAKKNAAKTIMTGKVVQMDQTIRQNDVITATPN